MDAGLANLEEIGMAAGRQVAGDAIERVQVEPGIDWTGEPKYDFWFLIDTDRLQLGQGLAMIRLRLSLIDELVSKGDLHDPFVHFVSREEWARRHRA